MQMTKLKSPELVTYTIGILGILLVSLSQGFAQVPGGPLPPGSTFVPDPSGGPGAGYWKLPNPNGGYSYIYRGGAPNCRKGPPGGYDPSANPACQGNGGPDQPLRGGVNATYLYGCAMIIHHTGSTTGGPGYNKPYFIGIYIERNNRYTENQDVKVNPGPYNHFYTGLHVIHDPGATFLTLTSAQVENTIEWDDLDPLASSASRAFPSSTVQLGSSDSSGCTEQNVKKLTETWLARANQRRF
jgi:hypothetical protein